MNKGTYFLIVIGLVIGNSLLASSCDISNILLQPGGYYAFPYKDTLITCPAQCAGPWYNALVGQSCGTSEHKPNDYYHTLVDSSCQKRFFFQALLYGCLADKGFNSHKQKVPLSDIIFSGPFQIQDVNLASKLAADGIITLPRMPGTQPPFGSTPAQQYIALLAPTQVKIQSEQRELGLNLTGMYHFRFPGTQRLVGVLGLLLPIRSQLHRMSVNYENGTLISPLAQPSPVPGQNTLTQFFNHFEGVDDFFNRAIVQPKGLQLNKWQRKTNIGDIVALTAVDAALCSEWIDACLIGIQYVLPSGNKQNSNLIWPIELGNGGGYRIEPFFNLYANVTCWVNPVLYAGARFSTKFTGVRRIPLLKTGVASEPLDQTQVIIPPGFENYIVAPTASFSEFDTNVLEFADQKVSAKISPGTEFLFRCGNFVENFLIDSLDLGFFYDMYLQAEETIAVDQVGVYNTALLTRNSNSTQHLISWRLGYTHDEYLAAYLGSQHTISGKNVPQDNKIYASISAYF